MKDATILDLNQLFPVSVALRVLMTNEIAENEVPPIDQDLEKLFQRKRVAIDVGTQVLMQIKGVVGRLPSQFIGRDGDRYMIFKLPRAQVNLSMRLVKGVPVVVRYRHQGRIFGFESMILDSVPEPFGLLFLTCPNIIEEHKLRKSPRLDCYVPCSVELSTGAASGVIVNMSTQGARCIFSGMKAAKGSLETLRHQDVKVQLSLAENEDPLNLAARILSAQQLHGAVSAGLKFENMDETVHAKLLAKLSEWEAG